MWMNEEYNRIYKSFSSAALFYVFIPTEKKNQWKRKAASVHWKAFWDSRFFELRIQKRFVHFTLCLHSKGVFQQSWLFRAANNLMKIYHYFFYRFHLVLGNNKALCSCFKKSISMAVFTKKKVCNCFLSRFSSPKQTLIYSFCNVKLTSVCLFLSFSRCRCFMCIFAIEH